jgi:hypothetical protein
VQIENDLRDRGALRTLPRELVKIAADEYNAQGYSQSFDRLNERGGLGVLEIVRLLADAYNRAKPT